MFTAVEKARETYTFQEMRFWQGDNVPPSPFLPPPPPSLFKGSPIIICNRLEHVTLASRCYSWPCPTQLAGSRGPSFSSVTMVTCIKCQWIECCVHCWNSSILGVAQWLTADGWKESGWYIALKQGLKLVHKASNTVAVACVRMLGCTCYGSGLWGHVVS